MDRPRRWRVRVGLFWGLAGLSLLSGIPPAGGGDPPGHVTQFLPNNITSHSQINDHGDAVWTDTDGVNGMIYLWSGGSSRLISSRPSLATHPRINHKLGDDLYRTVL